MTQFLGQDIEVVKNQLLAIVLNIWSWFCVQILPSWVRKGSGALNQAGFASSSPVDTDGGCCTVISGPGGLEKLQLMPLRGRATVGYNVPGHRPPFVQLCGIRPETDLVVVAIDHFSVNYADVTIRWGLYESALRFVGWPIVPGFDFTGTVECAGPDSPFRTGDAVFGFTMFGAYSSRCLVPSRQMRKIPALRSTGLQLPRAEMAGFPAVAATALHAVALAGAWPNELITANKAALIHSAAGGVGSMLIQICKLRGFSPVVAVVGSPHKVQYCRNLGADHVIDKSSNDVWTVARTLSPSGYAAVFDANGVETISGSYDALTRCGRLIVYGFHSNIPKAESFLSPLAWVKMVYRMLRMPSFQPMDLTLASKSVCGFNLSFFAEEHLLIDRYLSELVAWIEAGKICPSQVVTFDALEVSNDPRPRPNGGGVCRAHELIQSGKSVGKIVIRAVESAVASSGFKTHTL